MAFSFWTMTTPVAPIQLPWDEKRRLRSFEPPALPCVRDAIR
jgi:hypothetical protein